MSISKTKITIWGVGRGRQYEEVSGQAVLAFSNIGFSPARQNCADHDLHCIFAVLRQQS